LKEKILGYVYNLKDSRDSKLVKHSQRDCSYFVVAENSIYFITQPPIRVAEYCDERVCLCLCVCLSASTSLKLSVRLRSSPNFCAPIAVALSFLAALPYVIFTSDLWVI